MKLPAVLFTLAICLLFLSACASKKEENVEYERDRVSTIPWTKPANWEGGGALSGMAN